uniref:Uncharacterized protein n=1 Tax=Panagrolaimus sp. JU765 TaxID=591449 RepID=A0AC34QUJ2_9BILA
MAPNLLFFNVFLDKPDIFANDVDYKLLMKTINTKTKLKCTSSFTSVNLIQSADYVSKIPEFFEKFKKIDRDDVDRRVSINHDLYMLSDS